MSNPHAVAALIDAVKKANAWSDTDIVDNASKRGYPMSKSHISALRTQPLKSLVPKTARALAAGLNVSVRQVVVACLKAMDLPVDDQPMSVEAALRKELYPQHVQNMVLHALAASRGETA